MADNFVRTHTNPSNRAKAKDSLEKKVVFRSVLDNPFRVQWPNVPVNIQNTIVARFVEMARGVAEYHLKREKRSRKRKAARSQDTSSIHSSRKMCVQSVSVLMGDDIQGPVSTQHPEPAASGIPHDGEATLESPPNLLAHLSVGINQVTKLLETTVRSLTHQIVSISAQQPQSEPKPRLILVCRGDVAPPALIQHLPHLVAACNTRGLAKTAQGVHLVPLFKSAEMTLSDALGLRRASVVAIHAAAPGLQELMTLLEDTSLLTAPWLSAPMDRRRLFIPTHVKQLRTTAPRDMRAAKERRARGRAAARTGRKALEKSKAQP